MSNLTKNLSVAAVLTATTNALAIAQTAPLPEPKAQQMTDAYLCVPKTLSALMGWQNRLSWRNDWAAVFISCFRGRAIQVEEPA